MVTHYEHPHIKVVVTHSGSDYELQNYCVKTEIVLRENASSKAELLLADEGSDFYSNKITHDDPVKIYVNYKEVEDPLTSDSLRFYGFVEDLTPFLTDQGELLKIPLRGYDRCVLDLLCGEQYGSQSLNNGLDTVSEILTDGSNGIIPLWTNKLLGDSGVASGYTLDTTYVEAVAGTVTYLYYPYKPVKNCLDDLMNYLQAIKGANAGAHWIIKPEESGGTVTNYFCLATVANHPSAPINVASKWPTWWNTDQTGSTLIVKQDMVTQNFMQQRPEANYILYHGLMQKPVSERWTATGSSLWTVEGGASITLSDDSSAGNFKIGVDAVKMIVDDEPALVYVQVPSSNQGWEIDNWGGHYNKPTINFYAKFTGDINNHYLRLCTDASNYFSSYVHDDLASGVWKHFSWPIGPYWDETEFEGFDGWSSTGSPDWGNINYIRLYVSCVAFGVGTIWYDDFYMSAWVLRGAKKSGESYYKIKPITDDVAKDDSGATSDDSGTIGRMAYAELLRCSSTPITGMVVVPGQPTILAGQLAHIHGCKTSSGSFRVDKNMRVTEHRLTFVGNGLFSGLMLTDDLVNGVSMMPSYTMYNILQKASAPENQTRQVSSIKNRDVDISQSVMEKSY